jgi:hypothetical protein
MGCRERTDRCTAAPRLRGLGARSRRDGGPDALLAGRLPVRTSLPEQPAAYRGRRGRVFRGCTGPSTQNCTTASNRRSRSPQPMIGSDRQPWISRRDEPPGRHPPAGGDVVLAQNGRRRLLAGRKRTSEQLHLWQIGGRLVATAGARAVLRIRSRRGERTAAVGTLALEGVASKHAANCIARRGQVMAS